MSKSEIIKKYANDTNELEDFIRSYYYHKHRSSLIYVGTATLGVGLFIGVKSFQAYSKGNSTEAIGGFVLSPLLIAGGGYLLNEGVKSRRYSPSKEYLFKALNRYQQTQKLSDADLKAIDRYHNRYIPVWLEHLGILKR